MQLTKEDEKDVLDLILAKRGLLNEFKTPRNTHLQGQDKIAFSIRKPIWDFCHKNSTSSTNTNQIAKLKISEKPALQSGLEFLPTITLIRHHNCGFTKALGVL